MLPEKYQKRSFLRFDCNIDLTTLLSEYNSLSNSLWQTSYWGSIHCSIGMLLLRGGNKGTEFDFFADNVFDQDILKELPYICLLYTSPSPRDLSTSRMPSSA